MAGIPIHGRDWNRCTVNPLFNLTRAHSLTVNPGDMSHAKRIVLEIEARSKAKFQDLSSCVGEGQTTLLIDTLSHRKPLIYERKDVTGIKTHSFPSPLVVGLGG